MKRVTLSCLLLTLTACNPSFQSAQFEDSKTNDQSLQNQLLQAEQPIIQVTNLTGQALSGAQILIGNRLGQPFVKNLLQTDQNGQVALPPEWTSPSSVTVNLPGYMRLTYLNVQPGNLTFKLRPVEKTERIELSGTTSGFGNLQKDNIADFGIVMASLTKRDIFAFSLDKIISPEYDVISIAGFDSKVPSNITFPKQRETYVIPVTLEKERYRLYFNENGTKKVYALHGRFPFEETVDQIRNKVPFLELINYFQFTSGTMKEIMINGPTNVNIPVNEMTFSQVGTINPPVIEANKTMISIALFENNGYLYPTDLHRVENKSAFPLNGVNKGNKLFLSMIKNTSDFKSRGPGTESISAELLPMAPNHTPTFLSLINPPIGTLNGWKVQAPDARDIHPLTTYSVLSKVARNGKQKMIFRDWEIYAEGWINSADLPEWPTTVSSSQFREESIESNVESNRWEITYIGTNHRLPLPARAGLGSDVVDYTTHISFNSVEF